MAKLSRHKTNTILFTILVHLFAVLIGLIVNLGTKVNHIEEEIIFDFSENEIIEKIPEEIKEFNESDFKEYLSQINNAGSNNVSNNSDNSLRDNSNLSQEDIRKAYEEQMLREKYGDSYENKTNKTIDDYLPENFGEDNNDENFEEVINNKIVKNGNTLVFAELESDNRNAKYLHVPVYSCEGNGTITVSILLNNNGSIKNVKLLSSVVDKDEECLIDNAMKSAYKSRFNKTNNNSDSKMGTITYKFQQQ